MSGFSATVELDGQKRTDVTAAAIALDAAGYITATLTVIVDELDVDMADAEVQVGGTSGAVSTP